MAEFMAYIIKLVIVMIYKRIRDLREDKDWSQQKVADMLFINRRTYQAYENGVNSMNPETLIKLSKIYNVSIDYLLEQTDNPKNNKQQRNHQKIGGFFTVCFWSC